MTIESLLDVRDVVVRFGPVTALDGVSLTVEAGHATGLIGANGAGKSVLFDVISGFTHAQSGSVNLNGVDITGRTVPTRARMGLRRTFQGAELFDDLSVLENLSVGAARDVDVESFAAEVGLDDWAKEIARWLPGGMRRRVDIARALAGRPQVLLMDEPGAGLSGNEVGELAEWIRSIAASGVGVVLVDHDMDLISRVCDEVNVLDFGRLISSGTVDAVLRDGAVRRAYLGVDHDGT